MGHEVQLVLDEAHQPVCPLVQPLELREVLGVKGVLVIVTLGTTRGNSDRLEPLPDSRPRRSVWSSTFYRQGVVRWDGQQNRNWSPGMSDSSPGCVHCARQVGKGLPQGRLPGMMSWEGKEEGGRFGCSSANWAGILGVAGGRHGPQSTPGGARELPGWPRQSSPPLQARHLPGDRWVLCVLGHHLTPSATPPGLPQTKTVIKPGATTGGFLL